MVAPFLIFKIISRLFSIVAVTIYFPTSSVGAFPFLYTLSSIYCLQIFFQDFLFKNFFYFFSHLFLLVGG